VDGGDSVQDLWTSGGGEGERENSEVSKEIRSRSICNKSDIGSTFLFLLILVMRRNSSNRNRYTFCSLPFSRITYRDDMAKICKNM
jgi:hypothetical protein